MIQVLLGHAKLETTALYTRVAVSTVADTSLASRPRSSNPHRRARQTVPQPPRGFLLGRLSSAGPGARPTVAKAGARNPSPFCGVQGRGLLRLHKVDSGSWSRKRACPGGPPRRPSLRQVESAACSHGPAGSAHQFPCKARKRLDLDTGNVKREASIRRSHLALDCGRPGRGLRGCTCGRCVDQPVGLPRRVSALAPDWRRSGASRSAARTLSSSPSSELILASAISTFVSRAATCRINFLNLPIDVGAARRLWAGRDYHASPLPRRALSTGSAASASLAARSFAITGLRSNSATSGSWAGLGSSPSALAAQSMINRATDPSGAVGAEGVDPLRH